MENNIYDYIIAEETKYSNPIEMEDGWMWSMKEHIRRCFLYLNSQFEDDNEDRELRPFRNIILSVFNAGIRTKDFDVKDIEIFVNNPDKYYKSFIIKKYHEKWALLNGIDTFIDDFIFSYDAYGGTLTKDVKSKHPEVIDLRSISFCNQRDILSNPFCIEHTMSFADFRKQNKWGDEQYGATMSKEELITILKKEDKDEIIIKEVHGELPVEWLQDRYDEVDEESEDVSQVQIVAFYKDDKGAHKGVTLFKNREPKLQFKFLARDKIAGRALGRSAIEELFEPQLWTNWDEIKIAEMKEASSKILMQTDDPKIAKKHPRGLKDMDNLEIIQKTQGTEGLQQVNTFPVSLEKFNDSVSRWENDAQKLGAVPDPLLGETPNSGTPFKLYEAQQVEGKSMHKFRQGQIASHMDEIYRDWILRHVQDEINQEKYFLSEFSSDEMIEISQQVVKNVVNKEIIERILNGKILKQEEIDAFKMLSEEEFINGGNKRFIEILKNEFKDEPLNVYTNIVGKQKNLAMITDKIVNVVRQFLSTPEIRQDPGMVKLLNTILESSGLSPLMLTASRFTQAQSGGSTEPLKNLSEKQVTETRI